MSGEAAVGRSLSKLFGLFLGKWYFALALVGVYVGLAVMVKRAWPKGWSNRRTGILLFVLALTLYSSIADVDQSLRPAAELTGGSILSTLNENIRQELLVFDATDSRPMTERAISGGYVGAIQYSMLYALFGYFGAQLMMWVMFAISLMLMTGKSYVELGSIVRKRLLHLVKLLAAKRSQHSAQRSAAAAASTAANSGAADQADDYNDDDTIEDDDYEHTPRRKKRSLFFAWRQQNKTEEPEKQTPHDEWSLDELPSFQSQAEGQPSPHWAKELEQDWEQHGEDDKPLDEHSSNAQDDEAPWTSENSVEEEEQRDLQPATDKSEHWDEPWRQSAEYADAESDKPDPEVEAPESSHPYEPEEIDDLAVHTATGNEDNHDADEPLQSVDTAVQAAKSVDGEERVAAKAAASDSSEPVVKPYRLPPFSLLSKPSLLARGGDGTDSIDAKRKLEATLESFGVRAKVLDVVRGPAVTRYEVQPATGVKVSRIVSLTDDIALALAAKDIRMEAPIPGKSAIGIEVPNMEVSVVTMREVMETQAFQNAPSKLSVAFGRDISGQPIVGNLAKMPHLLVAGATGSGKSVCINGIITSILYKAEPDEVKFLMVDPKMVELNVYNGIPHLLAPVVTDPRRASLALKKIVVEMEKRYELFSKSGTRNIEGYNTLMAENPKAVLPYIVVIVDELADLMMVAANDVEDSIARLAQMARAAGIHLIIATQRPSVDVITGVIKANIPSRIAFGVSSQVDSRTILDMVGAEKLLGRGDMLFLPVGMSKPIRVQGAFLSDQEVEALVEYARNQAEAEYKEDLVPEIEEDSTNPDEILDELFDQAVQIVLDAKQASVSLLQRRMRIGYTRAARLIDQMEAKGIVGPYEGSKPREVLMSADQYQGRIPS
ncbi:DNA translocase FtsK 4TM domain-containing protein [Paenibacillus sp. NPDC058071]|uniref:DNA translocase FtsK 4TM domain-containing protein n=1 Tax=Paenibacillus sp. NPDC058071 TaxID=3346326 RepID=UPI0036DA0C04